MPQVGQKHFPYTEAGEKAAAKERRRYDPASHSFRKPKIRSGAGSAKQGGMMAKKGKTVKARSVEKVS